MKTGGTSRPRPRSSTFDPSSRRPPMSRSKMLQSSQTSLRTPCVVGGDPRRCMRASMREAILWSRRVLSRTRSRPRPREGRIGRENATSPGAKFFVPAVQALSAAARTWCAMRRRDGDATVRSAAIPWVSHVHSRMMSTGGDDRPSFADQRSSPTDGGETAGLRRRISGRAGRGRRRLLDPFADAAHEPRVRAAARAGLRRGRARAGPRFAAKRRRRLAAAAARCAPVSAAYFLLPALTVIGLLAWHHVEHDRWRFSAGGARRNGRGMPALGRRPGRRGAAPGEVLAAGRRPRGRRACSPVSSAFAGPVSTRRCCFGCCCCRCGLGAPSGSGFSPTASGVLGARRHRACCSAWRTTSGRSATRSTLYSFTFRLLAGLFFATAVPDRAASASPPARTRPTTCSSACASSPRAGVTDLVARGRTLAVPRPAEADFVDRRPEAFVYCGLRAARSCPWSGEP